MGLSPFSPFFLILHKKNSMPFLLKLIITAIVVIVAAWITPGVQIRSFFSAVIVAIVLALLNIFFKPLLLFLTIPITIVTFGLFLFLINAIVIYLTSKIVEGFYIRSFGAAFIFSIILSLINYIFDLDEVSTFLNL